MTVNTVTVCIVALPSDVFGLLVHRQASATTGSYPTFCPAGVVAGLRVALYQIWWLLAAGCLLGGYQNCCSCLKTCCQFLSEDQSCAACWLAV